jgi:hypothetical protein
MGYKMPWMAVAGLALDVVGSLFGASKSRQAGKDARKLGISNQNFILAETAEEKRRLGLQHEQTVGTAIAGIAGSGFRSGEDSMGGSHRSYLSTLKSEQQKELDWLTKSGQSRGRIAREGGGVVSSQLQSQAVGQFADAAKGVFSIVDEVRNG